jgi:DNA-binding MarR family transcriptional regulator
MTSVDRKRDALEQARTTQSEELEQWRVVMRSLSRMEAKVITIVADYQPVIVKEIARRGFITQQTASSTIGNLIKLDLVYSDNGVNKRESPYLLKDAALRRMLQHRNIVGHALNKNPD